MIVGLDVGYGWTKATRGLRSAMFPSVVGPAVEIKYSNDLISDGRGMEIERDGRRQFVGEMARLQSPFVISPLARERDLDLVTTLALAALWDLGARDGVHLVTGLPVAWYQDREALAAALTGTFGFSVNGDAWTVTVDRVSVVPQPFGSLFKALLNEDGVLADPAGLAHGEVGIIDVGTYTTDVALSNKLRYVEPRSGSIQQAMSEVYRLLQRAIQERHDLALELHQVEAAFQAREITLFGKQIKIDALIDEAAGHVAGAIIGYVEGLWPDRARGFARVLVTGGGGAVFAEAIEEVYPHAYVMQAPQAANSEGFLRYGLFKDRKTVQ